MGFVIGIDTGGTFTDCVVIDEGGRIVTAKASSTPGDFSEGVMESLRLAGEKLDLTTEVLLRDTDLWRGGPPWGPTRCSSGGARRWG